MEWYHYLCRDDKSSLEKCKSVDQGNMIVQREFRNERTFAKFESHLQFYQTLLSTPEELRCYYEVIYGKFPHKLYFDIDGNEGMDIKRLHECICDIVRETIRLFRMRGHELRPENFFLFTSCNSEKKSAHIILDGYCFANNDDVRNFVSKMNLERWTSENIVDTRIYKSKQMFRTLGSQKYGSKRTKIAVRRWSFENNIVDICEIPEDVLFLKSCISYVGDCVHLPAESVVKTVVYSPVDLDIDYVDKVLPPWIRDQYELSEIKGCLICLRRRMSSECKVCHRVHEHENAFLRVSFEDTKLKSVLFYCRRNQMLPLQVYYLDEHVVETKKKTTRRFRLRELTSYA